jgi:hypothetical protein
VTLIPSVETVITAQEFLELRVLRIFAAKASGVTGSHFSVARIARPIIVITWYSIQKSLSL